MGEYDSFYRCTIGTTSLVVMDHSKKVKKIVREGSGFAGRAIGEEITVEVQAYVTGTTPADLQANLLAAEDALSQSGLDFQLWANGLTNPQIQLLAARMVNGGPHFDYDILPQQQAGALRKLINFTVNAATAQVGGGGGGGSVSVQDKEFFDLKIERSADGLSKVTKEGEIRGPNLLDTYEQILANFQSQYPINLWTHTDEQEIGTYTATASDGTIEGQGDVLKYNMVAEENADELPGEEGGFAVSGTASMRSDRDEQHRMVEVWEFDLLVEGFADRVLETVRDYLPEGRIAQRETIEKTSIKEHRLRASFAFLRSADGDEKGSGLMNWTQSFRTLQGADVYDEKQYPGLSPILVKKPRAFSRLVQSGTAIGAGDFPEPPDPLFADALLEQPEITQTDLNDVEKQTEWSYTMAIEDVKIDPTQLARPKKKD